MALGLGVGGAAAAGLQSGFEMGRQADQDAERRAQRARDNMRQDQLDSQRTDQIARSNAAQDKASGEHDDDRALSGANLALQDSQYQLGALRARYPDGNIPDSEAKPLYTAVGQAHSARQAIVQKRYQPVVEATQQKWRDFASKAQVGQANPDALRGQDLRDFIKATTGHDLSDFANGAVGTAINDTTTGIQTKNPGLTIKGAGVLLGPQARQGVGATAPDGSQIVNKELYALVPAPRPRVAPAPQQNPIQGLSAALTAASAPTPPADPNATPAPEQPMDSDPTHSLAVLQVTSRQPDGSLTTYHAPVTKDRNDPNSPLAGPLSNADLMDRMGRLGVVQNWIKTPEMASAVQEALKDGTPTSFEQAWGLVHGDPKALAATDPTSVKIKAIKKLQEDEGYDTFEQAAQAVAAKSAPQAKGVQGTLNAIGGSDLTDAEKKQATKVALGLAAKPKAGKGGGGTGAGSGGTSPALGGAAAPDPKTAPDQTVDFWAKAVIAGDKDWQVGLSRSKSGSALIEQVKRRVPQMATELGLQPQDIGTARAQSAALTSTLKDLTKRSAAVDLFSSKVEKDMQTMDSLLDKASTGSPLLLSKPINILRRQFSDPDLAQLDLAAKQVGAEYERLITGGTLSVAQLHAGASEDAKKLINGDMPPSQARAVMKIMRVEMGNAKSAAHESTARVQNELRGLGNGPLGGVPPPSASPPARGVGGAAPAGPPVPAAGTVLKGYRFNGGDPANKANWVPVQ